MSRRLRFCEGCPDHEACATGASCHSVKDVDQTVARWTEAAPLHLAADHIRDNHGEDHPRHKFWSQLAAALEEAATPRGWENAGLRHRALDIANAYLEATS